MATESKESNPSLRFSSFNVISPLPATTTMSMYLHKEEQHSWAYSANASNKRKRDALEEPPIEELSEDKRGRNTVVIHPGSRWLRVGRASDILPISVPNVIARRSNKVATPEPFCGIRRPNPPRPDENDDIMDENINDEEENPESKPTAAPVEEDEATGRVAAFRTAFKDRLKTYGIRYQPGASESGANFNRIQTPEKVSDHNDSQRITWNLQPPKDVDLYFGSEVFLLADPIKQGFQVRWPFRGKGFNTLDRAELPALLNDISAIWGNALSEELFIKPTEYKTLNVVLVVPDLADRIYIKELVNILLVEMGFKQVAVHQEGVSASYGAQMSNACIVDVGAIKTSICCVEDGLIVPETRITLSLGGDDITETLYVLLQQSCFPYKEMDITRLYDWNLIQDLKHQYCTFMINISGARPYDLMVRRPGYTTERYKYKMYDENMAAPSVLFETGIVWYAEKRKYWRAAWNQDVQEDLASNPLDEITFSMKLSTDHILKDVARETLEAEEARRVAMDVDRAAEGTETNGVEKPPSQSLPTPKAIVRQRVVTNLRQESPPLIITGDENAFPLGYPIDIAFETSKLPLDVAVFNSARGAQENAVAPVVSKFLENVLLIGGGSLVPGLGAILEQRLHSISLSFYGSELEKLTVVQMPKELDPRVIVWKGASVLARLESSGEFWVTAKDWDRLGMRAFRDRSLFL